MITPTRTGTQMPMPIPTGTVTFLFTDIEGSTHLWDQQPRAMQAAVAHHDALLRESIEEQGGYVFKTMGDAFCAAFPTAPQALLAAITAQRALNATQWEDTGPIKVRMALHTGVAEVRDNDYFGQSLNRVARLLSAGHGGQVLLSLATQQLVRDYLPAGTSLKDLGEGGLKDLTRTEHVYQVVAPDLASEFPPLKSLDTQYIEPSEGGVEVHNPYKGLRAFQQADAADFFGREALTQQLLERLAEQGPLSRFLAVVGPSGSGKSSVVRAGVIPALRAGKMPELAGLAGSERWLVVEMLPGPRPLEELEAVLLRVAVNPPSTLIEQLQADKRGLTRAIKRVLPSDESVELVLVIDQFEEVFTLVGDEPARVHFLESLCAAVKDPRSRIRVIVTLRADFYDRPLLYPDPGELVKQRTEVVLPLSAEELERAIVEPAKRVGVSLEPELLSAMIKDVGEQPGSLPLLQYALTELFERRVGRTMTLVAYRESGGVTGALARRADELYRRLSADQQEVSRQLFLRLVTLGEGAEDTRRRVRLAELISAVGTRSGEEAPTALEGVLDAFGKYRLLTFDRDPVTHGPTVEVAHEALIKTWGRLREWLDESRSDLRVQRLLMGEAIEWDRAGKDPSYLASGARLAQFKALAEGADRPGGVALTAEEKEYLAASVEEREKQEKAERGRQAHELELARQAAEKAEQAARAQRSAASRLRVLLAGAVVFLVVAAILALLALNQSNVALANFQRSEAQRLASEASRLLQTGGSPEQAALLSVRSLNTQYTYQGDTALEAATTRDYPIRVFAGHTSAVLGVAISPDGKYVLTGSGDTTAKLWDATTGKEVRTFTGHTRAVTGVAFSPDGRYVLTGSADTTAKLWDATTGKEVRTFEGHTGQVNGVAFSLDGRYVLTAGFDDTARMWDATTGREVRTFTGHTNTNRVTGVAFSPDGRYVLTGSSDKTARLWDVQTGQEARTFTGHTDYIMSVAFSPDGKYVLTAGFDDMAILWDVQTGKEVRTFTGHTDWIWRVAFSPDGKYVLTSSSDKTARMWDATTGKEVRAFTDHTAVVRAVAISPDGKYVLTGSADTTAKLWDLQALPILPQFKGHDSMVISAVFSPDGKYVLTAGRDKTARMWDAQTGQEVRRFVGHIDQLSAGAVFSPDGKYVLTGADSFDHTARLWDATTATEVRRFTFSPTVMVGDVRYSPDGKYVLTALAGANQQEDVAILWDVQTGTEVRRFVGHTDQLWASAFSPDGKYVLTGSLDKTARLWNLQTGQELRRFTHPDVLHNIWFSTDSKWAITTCQDGVARIWDVQTGQEVKEFTSHTGGMVLFAVTSPDSKYLLTALNDSTARLWDIQTGEELRRFAGHTGQVEYVQFSLDGKYVLTASDDGTARIWDVDYHTTIQRLCGRLLRDFTDEERATYEIKDSAPTCPKP